MSLQKHHYELCLLLHAAVDLNKICNQKLMPNGDLVGTVVEVHITNKKITAIEYVT